MAKCKARITHSNGVVNGCSQEVAKGATHGCCYYHEKVLDGLCSPLEFDSGAIVEMGDRVDKISVGSMVLTY